MSLFDLTAERERLGLAADCARCFGLCCVAHGFRASANFAVDKPPGKPCPNLLADFGCAIHRTLRQDGFSGCTAYTCFGAGQKVAQGTFGGIDWRQAPETAELMFQTFPIVRQLNELLWFVTEALDRCLPGAEHQELLNLLEDTERLAATPADEMSWGDVDVHCLTGETVLGKVSAAIRAAAVPVEREPTGRPAPGDLPEVVRLEADRRGGDLRRSDLRGARFAGGESARRRFAWCRLLGCGIARCRPERCRSALGRPDGSRSRSGKPRRRRSNGRDLLDPVPARARQWRRQNNSGWSTAGPSALVGSRTLARAVAAGRMQRTVH